MIHFWTDQRCIAELSTDQDWIGLDRTAIFLKIGGSGLDRTEKILVILM